MPGPTSPAILREPARPGYPRTEASGRHPARAIVGYLVYRSTVNDFAGATRIASPGNVLQYKDSSTTKNRTYYYWVTAANGVGEGPPSIVASVTPTK